MGLPLPANPTPQDGTDIWWPPRRAKAKYVHNYSFSEKPFFTFEANATADVKCEQGLTVEELSSIVIKYS